MHYNTIIYTVCANTKYIKKSIERDIGKSEKVVLFYFAFQKKTKKTLTLHRGREIHKQSTEN